MRGRAAIVLALAAMAVDAYDIDGFENDAAENEWVAQAVRFCAADQATGMMGARLNVALDGRRFEPCW
jgi:hypothetical protein